MTATLRAVVGLISSEIESTSSRTSYFLLKIQNSKFSKYSQNDSEIQSFKNSSKIMKY